MTACKQVWLGCFVVLAAAMCPPAASAIAPDSPEVRKILDKAFEYLATANDGRLGGKCLIGLAFLKDGKPEDHPKVDAAIKACQAAAKPAAAEIKTDIYSTGIAIIFLCSVNSSKYSAEIIKFRDSLEARQKSHGGWGYPEKETGDTSMTQYGVLAYWEMSKVGFPTSLESTERVANWLLRTQAPEGNWGYQGKEAEGRARLELVKQDSARLGMSAAGLGATYMVADLLGFGDAVAVHDASLPLALKPIRKGQPKTARTKKVELRHVRNAQDQGREWMTENFAIETPSWNYYYLYALERYQSFLEAAEGRSVKDPRWYNEGYAFLKRNQDPTGSWKAETAGMEAVDTAFACLFLLRSTKKAIDKSKSYGEGALLAGRGLPDDTQLVRIRGGQIVSRKADLTAKQLLDVLSAPDHILFTAVAIDVEFIRDQVAAAPEAERAQYVTRLRKLVAGGVADARLAAVESLGMLRDVRSGEALIAALDDPDWRVVVAADTALQTIGRSLSPSGLTDEPDDKARTAAKQRWKQWYVAIRPDAQFPN
ncbi:MAG: hypothetical protein WD872_06265 [Pirellulaceae bacterium]